MKESSEIHSKGTYNWANQPGSSYPQAFYGYHIPLENEFFKDYLRNKNIRLTYPLASGYQVATSYAPAGGVTSNDVLKMCKLKRGCHQQLPARQNKESYILDSYREKDFCPYKTPSPLAEEFLAEETLPEMEAPMSVPEEEMSMPTEEIPIEEEMPVPIPMEEETQEMAPPVDNLSKVSEDINKSIILGIGVLLFLGFYYS